MNSPYEPIYNQPQFRGAPGNIPFAPQIQCSPHMVPLVNAVTGNLINIIQRDGDGNLLRQNLFYAARGNPAQMYGTDYFIDLVGKTIDILEMRLAYQPNQDVNAAIVATCTDMCAYHAAMFFGNQTPPGYLTNEQVQSIQACVNEWRHLEQQAAAYFTPQQQQYQAPYGQQSMYSTRAPMGAGGGYTPAYNPGGNQQPVPRQSGLGGSALVSPLAQVQAVPVVTQPVATIPVSTYQPPMATAPAAPALLPMSERPTIVQALHEAGPLSDYIGISLPYAFSADYQIAIYRKSGSNYRMQVINIEEATMEYRLHATEHLLKNRAVHYEPADFAALQQNEEYKSSIETMLTMLSAQSYTGGVDSAHTYDVVRFYDPILINRALAPHDYARSEIMSRDATVDFALNAAVFTVVSFDGAYYTGESADAVVALNKATDFLDLKRLVMLAKPVMESYGFGELNRNLTNHVNELLACTMNDPATINSFVDDIEELHDYLTTDFPTVMDKLQSVGLPRILDTTVNVEAGVMYSEFHPEDGNTAPRFCEFETWIFVPLPGSAISLSGYNDVAEVNRSNTPELFDLLEETRAMSSPNIRRTRLITLDGETLWVFRSLDAARYVISTHKDF